MGRAAVLTLLCGSSMTLAAATADTRLTAEPAEENTFRPTTMKLVDERGNEFTLDPAALLAQFAGGSQQQPKRGGKPDWKSISEGFRKVVSTTDGRSLYTVWVNDKTNQVLAELPRGFQNQKHYFAMTVAGGEIFAGLQSGEAYVYWKQYGDDRVALVAPQA